MLGRGGLTFTQHSTIEEIRGWILTNHNIAPNMPFPVINPNVADLKNRFFFAY